jgi:putrescine transport system substrate-binding protein
MARGLPAVALALLTAACTPSSEPHSADPSPGGGRVVHMLGWPDCFPPDLLPRFERETGIRVVLDVTDGNATLEARLMAGNSGYDLVQPTGSFLARQIEAGLYRPLDRALVPNLSNLDPRIVQRMDAYDPGMRHAVPYLESTYGLALDRAKVLARLGAEADLETWAAVFDPANAARLRDCGIFMYDSPHFLMTVAYLAAGIDPTSESAEDLARVEALLAAVRPHVRTITLSSAVSDLADRAHCAMIVNSADLKVARDRVREAGNAFGYDFVVPREGGTHGMDVLAIPADAPHPREAHALIDFLLRPDVVAAVINFQGVPIAVPAALPLVHPELRSDPLIAPSPDLQARQYPDRLPDPKVSRARTRVWTRFVACSDTPAACDR